MSKKKTLVLGYFGYESNQLDGQTVKTRSIFDLLKSKAEEERFVVSYFDTEVLKTNKLNVFKMFRSVIKCDSLIYLPAHGNLTYVFPIIFILCSILNINIHYIVVGGWLAEFIEKKPIHIWMLRKVAGIYPQTQELCMILKDDYNFKNVYQLHNFRIVKKNVVISKESKNIKLVYMARVIPKKGVKTLFELGKMIKKSNLDDIDFDIYGPIAPHFKNEFEILLNSQNLIKYKGKLEPDKIYDVISKYDLMLLPTQFYTEGFPGSILDAYISEVPVVVSNWQYSKEFVEDGTSGVIAEFNNEQDFIDKTIKLIKNPHSLDKLKNGVKSQKHKYSAERGWEIIKHNLLK